MRLEGSFLLKELEYKKQVEEELMKCDKLPVSFKEGLYELCLKAYKDGIKDAKEILRDRYEFTAKS